MHRPDIPLLLLVGFWFLSTLAFAASPEIIEGAKREGKDRDGYDTALYKFLHAMAYNTKLVRKQELPRSYDDLLEIGDKIGYYQQLFGDIFSSAAGPG